jgi:hypothetical protein
MVCANASGLGLTLFCGWKNFVEQVLLWCGKPKPIAARIAVGFTCKRLIVVEADPAAVALWHALTCEHDDEQEIVI